VTVRGALEADDELTGLGEQSKFRVRETPDWREHATDLEAEMLGRGMLSKPGASQAPCGVKGARLRTAPIAVG
jgi:hypothetical protein